MTQPVRPVLVPSLSLLVASCADRNADPAASAVPAASKPAASDPAVALTPVPTTGTVAPMARSPADDSAALIDRVTKIPATELLAPKEPVPAPAVPLAGTIQEYVAAVVENGGKFVVATEVEGMSLTVIADVTKTPPAVDRLEVNNGPGRDQADVEAALDVAP